MNHKFQKIETMSSHDSHKFRGVRIMFFAVIFFGLFGLTGNSLATTPTISGVSGTVATGQTLTIIGTNMMDEDKTGWLSMFQSGSAYGFEDALSQTSGSGSVGAWDYSCGGGYCSFDPNVKLSGSKSARFHIAGAYADHDNPSTILYFAPPSNPSQYWQRGYIRYDGTGWPTAWFKMWWLGGSGAYKVIQPNPGSVPTGWLYGTSNGYDNLALSPSGNIQRGRWYCIEFSLQDAGSYMVMNTWVDGSLASSSPVDDPEASIGPNDWQEIGIINLSGTNSSFSVDHYEDNYTVSTSGRIYCSSIIEIGNNSNYATATRKYQEPIYLSDGSVQIKADLSGLGSGPYYLFVTNNRQETSVAYNLSGGGDPTPPTVSLAAPTSGSTVSGTITVSANASDDVGVAGVQFKLDSANLSTEDTTSPYSISWDTTLTSNGSHTLTATARDAAGNETTSSVVSITVDNADTTPPAAPTRLSTK